MSHRRFMFGRESVPVHGDDLGEGFPEPVVLGDDQASRPGDVLVPTSERCPERHWRPHLPRRHLPHDVLRRLGPLGHLIIRLSQEDPVSVPSGRVGELNRGGVDTSHEYGSEFMWVTDPSCTFTDKTANNGLQHKS